VTPVTTDWTSSESLHACCDGIEAVVHLAAMNAANSKRDPVAALEMNGVSTARLIQVAIKAGVRRFVYISTAHVYGSPLAGTITEETCPRPLHPYATSHRAAEDVVRTASTQGFIEGAVLRLSNAFGSPARAEADCWDLLFNDLCRQAVVSGALVLRSSGMQRRDFISMTDACRAIQHCLRLPAASLRDRVFNLGGQWSPTILEAATFVADRYEQRGRVRPVITLAPAAPGEKSEPLDYRIDLLKSTGFVPAMDTIGELDGLIAFCETAFGS
jgi:UDP-glucose 4-epimerase